MIDLTAITNRWRAAFSGDADPQAMNAHEARAGIEQAVEDLHALTKLAAVVQAFGARRMAVAAAFEVWQATLEGGTKDAILSAAVQLEQERRQLWLAQDRVERLAVAMAGGDVERVCEGEADHA